MSQHELVVPTPFQSVAEFADGMAGRVEPDRLILYGPESYPEGASVHFRVVLNDGETSGLQGVAVVHSSLDAWEEQGEEQGEESRAAEMRYDLILEELVYDTMSEIVRDRILQLETPGDRVTGEVRLPNDPNAQQSAWSMDDALNAVENLPEDGPAGPDLSTDQDWTSEPVYIADQADLNAEEVEAAVADVSPGSDWPDAATATVNLVEFEDVGGTDAELTPDAAAGPLVPLAGAVLIRPSRAASWFPSSMGTPELQPGSGFFAHLGSSLPLPGQPPRPELESHLLITAAPRPGAAFVSMDTQIGVANPDFAVAEVSDPAVQPSLVDVNSTAAFDYASSELSSETLGEVTVGADVEIGDSVQFPESLDTLGGVGPSADWVHTAELHSPEYRDEDLPQDDPDESDESDDSKPSGESQ